MLRAWAVWEQNRVVGVLLSIVFLVSTLTICLTPIVIDCHQRFQVRHLNPCIHHEEAIPWVGDPRFVH